MSRIGKKPIDIPGGVKVELKGLRVKVAGPLGQLEMDCHRRIKVKIQKHTLLKLLWMMMGILLMTIP